MVGRSIHDRQRPWRLGLENWELEGCPLLYACADGKLEPGDSGRKVQTSTAKQLSLLFDFNDFLTLCSYVQKADDMETGSKNRSQETERTRLDHRLSREIHVAM